MSWISQHAHVIIAAVSVTGTVLVTVAANTTGLLPNAVGAWLAAAGTIIITVLGHVVVPPVAEKLSVRFKH
jgi:hypothetical protein